MAEVTTALCAERQIERYKLSNTENKVIRLVLKLKHSIVTFNPFPEIIAVPSYRCEFAQVMVGAPDVHILILWAADYEGIVMAIGRRFQNRFFTVKNKPKVVFNAMNLANNTLLNSSSLWKITKPQVYERGASSPEACLDLTAAVDITLVFHG